MGATCDQDLDECSGAYNGGCEQICNNMIGTYYCSCDIGYTLAADARQCQRDGVPTAATPTVNSVFYNTIISIAHERK